MSRQKDMSTAKKRLYSAKPLRNVVMSTDPNSNGVMSQDLIIARYLEGFTVNKKKSKKKDQMNDSEHFRSPYMSLFHADASSDIVLSRLSPGRLASSRPLSGRSASLRPISARPFSGKASNKNLVPHPPKRGRPISAPVYQLGTGSWSAFDDLNGSYSASMISSASLRSNAKAVYRRRRYVLCVQAFINGSRETTTRVTAADLSQLLVECTGKLGLTSAARKLFLGDGTLVAHAKQLHKDCEVYVSMGEPFKDPYLSLQEKEKLRKSSFWTMSGIMLPVNDKKPKRQSSSISNRMMELLDSQKRRILVFKNGESFGGMEILANGFDEFLDDCTVKLKLNSGARALYDWSGKNVETFSQVPCLDKVLQPSSGFVLGPLWVTKGEVFSPKGAYNFLSTMITNTKERIKSSKGYVEQLEAQLNNDDPHVFYSDIELGAEIVEESQIINHLQEALPKLESHLKKIQKLHDKEESMSSSLYKFKNISEIDSNSRLVGTAGIRIRFYVNGTPPNATVPVKLFVNTNDLMKGTKTKTEVMQRFFDYINVNTDVMSLFGSLSKRSYIKKAFLINGTEVTDIDSLEQGEQLWLSLGESFLPVEYPVLTVGLDKVKIIDLWGMKEITQQDMWLGADQNQTKAKLWNITSPVPSECEKQEMKIEMTNEEKLAYYKQSCETRVPDHATFVQLKENQSLVLYPELLFSLRGQEGDGDIWGSAIHQWCISNDGLISNKHFKNLVLGILDQEIQMTLTNEGEEELLDGAVVSCCVKPDKPISNSLNVNYNCLWTYTADGYIQSAANPGHVLTAVVGFSLNKAKTVGNQNGETLAGQHWDITSNQVNGVVVTGHPSFSDRSDSSTSSSDDEDNDDDVDEERQEKRRQKKEKKEKKESQPEPGRTGEDTEENVEAIENAEVKDPFENVEDVCGGQNIFLVVLPRFPEDHQLVTTQKWAIKAPHPVHSNISEKWSRQNLFWPVDRTESFLESVVEGFLTYNAPKLKWRLPKDTDDEAFKVSRVEGPVKLMVLRNGETDVTRAVKVVGPDIKSMKRDIRITSAVSKSGDGTIRYTPSDIELFQFLERCTDALNLPFAARRVFTSTGKEIASLVNLEKNELVYVSCGENWNNPSGSLAENQKRLLLANLAADVVKIRKFVALRKQIGFIIKVEGDALTDGKKLCLMDHPYDDDVPVEETEEQINQIFEAESKREVAEEDKGNVDHLTAHQRSHLKQNESTLNLSYNDEESRTLLSHREALFGTDKHVQENCSFKWMYSDEFIYLQSNPNLVIGVLGSENNNYEDLMVCRREYENANQRWLMCTDGTICLKANPNRVIAVTTPSERHDVDDDIENGYSHAKLILSLKKRMMNGNSNQLFFHDQDTGHIHAFATDEINMEMTAANKSGICTYAVFGDTKVFQPGYFGKLQTVDGKMTKFYFCDACSRCIRGKQKLETLNELTDFSCAMGQARKNKIKMIGAFQCLNGKVDLSTLECESTLAVWEMQLQRLRQESSIRAIASEMTLTQSNPAVRVLAHRNGDIKNEGLLVIGNMISQILDMCTVKLGLPKAARRLYTMDGELITNMQQLLKPYYPELTYMNQLPPNSAEIAEHDADASNLAIEKLDVRIPIDVCVSCGEHFVPLNEVEKAEILSKYERSEKTDTTINLELEKHRLRQAKGRRLSGRNSNQSVKSVLTKKRTAPFDKEDKIEESITKLKMQLDEVNSQQENRAKDLSFRKSSRSKLLDKMKNMKLYQIPQALKLAVFPNGENPERTHVVFAQSFQELLDNASYKLALVSCARRVFTVDGEEIFSMENLKRGQTICVTSGEKFVPYKDRRYQMDMKATWSRANRQGNIDENNNLMIVYKETEDSAATRSPILALPSPRPPSNQVTTHSFEESSYLNSSKYTVSSSRPKSARMVDHRK